MSTMELSLFDNAFYSNHSGVNFMKTSIKFGNGICFLKNFDVTFDGVSSVTNNDHMIMPSHDKSHLTSIICFS